MDQKFKQYIGELMFNLIVVQEQLDQANAKIRELEEKNKIDG